MTPNFNYLKYVRKESFKDPYMSNETSPNVESLSYKL